jgi:tRNA(Ile)-lysidine synthase
MAAEEVVLAALREALLDRHQGPVVALLSGGPDSVCLLDGLLRTYRGRRLVALHVNYRLRPEAEAEEVHCRELCAALGVELQVCKAEPPPPENLHAWARQLRYREAVRLARSLEEPGLPGLVATGHTADDQLETVLYRLCVSPGRRALVGMRPRRGRLVRPLLGVWRPQVYAYLRSRGLPWREDPSNLEGRFARARVRTQLREALRAVHPAAERNVLRTASQLREEGELLEALVERELAGAAALPAQRLAALDPALARLLLVALAERATGRYVPQAAHRLGEVVALIRASHGGAQRRELHLGGGATAVVEGGMLRVVSLQREGGKAGKANS